MRQRKPYKRLLYKDRKKLEKMLRDGLTIDEAAHILGVNTATVYREIKRCGEPYKADAAQKTLGG